MQRFIWQVLSVLILGVLATGTAFAQDDTGSDAPIIPTAHRLSNVGYEAQLWNNCGPATLTNALTFFGYGDNQRRAQDYLKPNIEDKNVSPHEMVSFVNNRVAELPVYAMERVGGDLDTLKLLLANNFPIIIEQGYDPPPHDLGWMGHYLLLFGYDDSVSVFITHDSYDGANLNYGYDHIQEFWQHFNYTYIVLYTPEREARLLDLLGEDADPLQNTVRALNRAVEEATSNQQDGFAWFNIGTNYVRLAQAYRNLGDEAGALDFYTRANTAYTQARTVGLPWRMLWYQFGPYEALYELAQASDTADTANYLYNEMTQLAATTIQNCQNPDGVCYVEETYYWAGRAREALGETQRALTNYNTALQINSNYTEAAQARDALANGG